MYLIRDYCPKYTQGTQLNSKKTHNLIKNCVKDLNRHFSKTYKCPTGIRRKCSALLIIREMQLKSTMGYHLIPDTMAITKKKKIASVGTSVD
jgi:hypothetical protein